VKINAAAAADARADAEKESKKVQADYDRAVREMSKTDQAHKPRTTTRTATRKPENPIGDILGSRTGQTVIREVLRGIFSTLKRK
jgi:hypothetical protein